MDELRISIKGWKAGRTAEVVTSGESIFLCANGKQLQISPGELYDMITLLMSQYYEDFTDEEKRFS